MGKTRAGHRAGFSASVFMIQGRQGEDKGSVLLTALPWSEGLLLFAAAAGRSRWVALSAAILCCCLRMSAA